MALKSLKRWWAKRSAEPKPEQGGHLHDPNRFRELLHAERLRSDRTGQPFALATFQLTTDEHGDRPQRMLAERLAHRARLVDHVGRFDQQRLGVILTGSDETGAWTFVESVLRDAGYPAAGRIGKPSHIAECRCEVYVYPDGEPRRKVQESKSRRVEEDAPIEPHRDSATLRLCQSATGTAEHHSPFTAHQPLEMLLARPLPRWKRTIDVSGGLLGLVLLSPVLLAAAALIKLTSRGPVLFKQKRAGLGGRPFTIYKFRTMYADAEARQAELLGRSEQDGPAFKLTDDPRVTPLGRYLRKTCLDELPQLWNVLKGDMSLVGPRPLALAEARQITGWQRRRLEVTPGLTCIWQVHGKHRVPFVEWMRMDIRYLTSRSLLQDLKLIARTAGNVLLHRASC